MAEKRVLTEESDTIKNFLDKKIFPILREHFRRDEFLGRINEILLFLPFNNEDLKSLTKIEMERWTEKARKRHDIELSWTPEVVDLLKKGYNVHYGARSIHHEVEKTIVNKLAKAYENELISNGSKVLIFEENGQIGFKFSTGGKWVKIGL